MNEQWVREGFEHYYVVPKTDGEVYEEQKMKRPIIFILFRLIYILTRLENWMPGIFSWI